MTRDARCPSAMPPSGPLRVFVVTDTTNYQKAMTDCLRSLLQRIPLK